LEDVVKDFLVGESILDYLSGPCIITRVLMMERGRRRVRIKETVEAETE